MSISILVEPRNPGYRAKTGGPLDLVADAATVPDAVAAVRAQIADRLGRGAVLIEQSIAPLPPVAVMPLADNPLFDDWLKAVEIYREQSDTHERSADDGSH